MSTLKVNNIASADGTNAKQTANLVSMPDYANGTSGTSSTYVQVSQDSFVVVWGGDPFHENYYVYVSPDNGTTTYIVGRRSDDTNANTEGTSFSFNVPKDWYFFCGTENGYEYRIYPFLKN